ncbi:MAG TPA: beta-galactosidase, partial [Verrucomicrobiae bacterium]|nr:beta-galactosidase [Verrucomicrobiae bacterium]
LTRTAFSQISTNAPPETRWQRSAEEKKRIAKDVVWTTHEPLEFLLRRGDHFADEADRYEHMYDPANLQRMADAGVRWGRLYFYKGFGLEAERPNMEKAKNAAAIMHKLGMKVALYMGGTMFTESLYHEIPEAKKWEQRDQNDHWIPYGIQTFRHYACPNEPAYRDYLKRILKIGVEDVQADEISFDNLMLQPEPDSCRCPRCISAFHDFLRKHYPTKEAVMRRFGLPDVDWIVPNEWNPLTQPDGLTALNDPVLQEWVRFRCESLANYSNDLSDYVKSLNSNVVVYVNIKGVYSFNRYWANAVYHPLYAGHIDVLAFDTSGYDPHIDASTGALVSQIRSYKMARRIGSACDEPMGDEVGAAMQMAFGYQKPVGGYAGAPWVSGANSAFTPSLEFFRHYNERYYTGVDNVADVAVLHNWPSMAYSINATYTPVTLMEQVLIQHEVPFDLLFDEQLDRLGHYGAVILAGQECVSDAQAKLLLQYVQNGGNLILTGNTAQYNEWRERRRTNPFLPARIQGKGRIVYIPEIIRGDKAPKASALDFDPEPGAALQRGTRMSPSQWVLPKNHQEIFQTIADGLPQGLSLTSDAPLATVMELLTRAETHETIAHFINFDRTKKVEPFHVTVRKQFPGAIKSVTAFTPDADDPSPVAFEDSGDHVTFTVPVTRVYSMIVIGQ